MLYSEILKQIFQDYEVEFANIGEYWANIGGNWREDANVRVTWHFINLAPAEERQQYPSSQWTTKIVIDFQHKHCDDEQCTSIVNPHLLALDDLKTQVLNIVEQYDMDAHWAGFNGSLDGSNITD